MWKPQQILQDWIMLSYCSICYLWRYFKINKQSYNYFSYSWIMKIVKVSFQVYMNLFGCFRWFVERKLILRIKIINQFTSFCKINFYTKDFNNWLSLIVQPIVSCYTQTFIWFLPNTVYFFSNGFFQLVDFLCIIFLPFNLKRSI